MVSVCPMEPNTISWLATYPIERTEWTGTPATSAPRAPSAPSISVSRPGASLARPPRASEMISAVRTAVPEGASFLLQWWHLDDLRLREKRGGRFGELHHEDGAGREVGRVEQTRSGRGERGELLEHLVGEPGRAHNAVNAGGKRRAQVPFDHVRLREVDQHVELGVRNRIGHAFEGRERRIAGCVRIDAACDFHILGCGHCRDHRRTHATRATRYGNLDHR